MIEDKSKFSDKNDIIQVMPFKYAIICPDCKMITSIIHFISQKYHIQITYSCLCKSTQSQFLHSNISLYQYKKFISLSLFYSANQCLYHKTKSGIIYSNYLASFICFNCFYSLIYKQPYSNLFMSSSILYSYSKCLGLKFSQSLKESSCIRSIVSLSGSKIAMLIDKRVSIWDYSLNKVILNFFDNYYISELVSLKDSHQLLSYGYSLCVWNLLSLDKSKRPDLPEDHYMIQMAIELSNEKIAFITEEGAFIWDYATGEYHNECPCFHMSTVFLFEMPQEHLIFCSNDIIYQYNIIHDITNRILVDSIIVIGELIKDYCLAVITHDKQLMLFQLNNKEKEFEYQCILNLEILTIKKDWEINCFLKEMIDGTIILFYDNDLYLLNTINGNLENVFKENKGKVNKIALLKGGDLGILINSRSFILYDINFMQKKLEFTEKYGNISTFNELDNGDIAISEIMQEYYYSLRVLQ